MFFSSSSCCAIHVQGSMPYSLGRRARLSGESRISQIRVSSTRYDSSLGPTHSCVDPPTDCMFISLTILRSRQLRAATSEVVLSTSLRQPTVVAIATCAVSSNLSPAPRSGQSCAIGPRIFVAGAQLFLQVLVNRSLSYTYKAMTAYQAYSSKRIIIVPDELVFSLIVLGKVYNSRAPQDSRGAGWAQVVGQTRWDQVPPRYYFWTQSRRTRLTPGVNDGYGARPRG